MTKSLKRKFRRRDLDAGTSAYDILVSYIIKCCATSLLRSCFPTKFSMPASWSSCTFVKLMPLCHITRTIIHARTLTLVWPCIVRGCIVPCPVHIYNTAFSLSLYIYTYIDTHTHTHTHVHTCTCNVYTLYGSTCVSMHYTSCLITPSVRMCLQQGMYSVYTFSCIIHTNVSWDDIISHPFIPFICEGPLQAPFAAQADAAHGCCLVFKDSQTISCLKYSIRACPPPVSSFTCPCVSDGLPLVACLRPGYPYR